VTGPEPADDRRFMTLALEEARRAAAQGEVPVGAVLVAGGEVLASRGNEREQRHDPTAHAEMLVLRDAAALAGGWRLQEATLYVTLEPCAMCAGAMVLARIERLVYGADDPKAGAAGSVLNVVDHPALNHRPRVRAGLMATEASGLLREFFAGRREREGTSAKATGDAT
jgi:tRNA(adenine34) deaminase